MDLCCGSGRSLGHIAGTAVVVDLLDCPAAGLRMLVRQQALGRGGVHCQRFVVMVIAAGYLADDR